MKKFYIVFLTPIVLSSCNGWFFQGPNPPPTPFLPATNTPSIASPTPVVIGASATPAIATSTTAPSSTTFNVITNTPLVIATIVIPSPSVSIDVLGCNTSIDVTHSMGEVTNAFVILKNTGNVELTNLKATLFALDEGREHPDKTVEIRAIPVGYQVTIKLTVDSTYRQETPIQVEVTSAQGTFPRAGEASCRDIGLFAPNPDELTTPVPANP